VERYAASGAVERDC